MPDLSLRYQHILLVEDDQDDQELFLLAVKEIAAGVQCTAESDPVRALQKLKEHNVNPDIIFLDLNMPVMDGMQFLTAVKNNEALRQIPVVVLSTSAQQSARTRSLSLGAIAFITKPNDFNDLTRSLAAFFG